MAGSVTHVAPSMPGFTWLYSGQASTVVTSSRNAARAAAGSASSTTSCSNESDSLPHIRASYQAGALATTVAATVHSGGSIDDPSGRPQASSPELICSRTSGSAAGTSLTRSAGVTNRAARGRGVEDGVAPRLDHRRRRRRGARTGGRRRRSDGHGHGRRRLGLDGRPRLRHEHREHGDPEHHGQSPPPPPTRRSRPGRLLRVERRRTAGHDRSLHTSAAALQRPVPRG